MIILASLSACNKEDMDKNYAMLQRDPIDRKADITRDEFANILRPNQTIHKQNSQKSEVDELTLLENADASGIPPIADIALFPDAPEIESNKRVTLTINENIELRDVLLELARSADLELALDPGITGGIILSVKNRPVSEVMEMVADLANLKYSVTNGILRVSADSPYLVNYQVDYLNMVRNATGGMEVKNTSGSDDGGSSSSNSSSSGNSDFSSSSTIKTGSSTAITTDSKDDLWDGVRSNITSILASGKPVGNANNNAPQDSVNINKQAGVISVFTTQKKHRSVKDFLDAIMNNTSAQVLIEAKVLEVELNDSYATGIDWSLTRDKFRFANAQGLSVDSLSDDFLTNTVFSGLVGLPNAGYTQNDNSKALLQFIQGFGTTRAISNPRITIQNNQLAVLSFARNEAFFTINVTPANTTSTNTSASSSETAISSTLNTVPIGVILALQPSINIDTQEITMHIRPTLTSKVGEIQDPAVRLNAISLAQGNAALADSVSNLNSQIPVIQVRELDTVLKAKSGEVMVIGGLLQHSDRNADIGLPFLSGVPILGNLTKKVEKTSNVTETIILMTAKIIPPRENYHEHDKALYQKLIQDPRPFKFN